MAGWPQRYQAALCKYLQQGMGVRLPSAGILGRQAVVLGMETLDVALAHEQGLMTWVLPGGSHKATPRMFARANAFFAEAVIPIEKTHHAAQKSDRRVNRLTQVLRQRTMESSASTCRLKQSIIRRRGIEAAIRKSERKHSRLLVKARSLQKHLRHLTHACLRAQELNRKRLSGRLYDEIAQTLLAINLRLLRLKTSTMSSTQRLTKEVANTRRVVKQFVRRVEGFAHAFDNQQQT